MSGIFAQWQPAYAAHQIPTFPVTDKKPSVSGYLKLGLVASGKLADKFSSTEAFGFALGPKSRITVLDIDTKDERILSDALSRHGSTPVIVRSGGGNHQAWYRHDGERRHIRPWRDRYPIDVLGGGYVVAPPSQGAKGHYTFIEGRLDDLDCLPIIAGLNEVQPKAGQIRQGERNNLLWRHCMRQAPHCDDFDGMLDVATTFNDQHCLPPLGADEVIRTAKSTWTYQERGENWFGSAGVVTVPHDLQLEPDELYLYVELRRAHGGLRETFAIAIYGFSQSLGWGRRRLTAARNGLVAKDTIELVHQGGSGKSGDVSTYRFVRW